MDRLYESLPERHDLEADLETKLAQQTVLELQPEDALGTLDRIFRIKAPGRQATPIRSGMTFWTSRQTDFRSLMQKNQDVFDPTIFVEYFCGPRNTYAIVWSLLPGGPPKPEQPTEPIKLVRLCKTSELCSPDGTLPPNAGQLLVGQALKQVPNAVEVKRTGVFKQKLGIVLGLDDLIPADDHLGAASLFDEPARSRLEFATGDGRAGTEEWNSLDELEKSDKRAMYGLTKTLLSDVQRPTAVSPQLQWAWRTLIAAMATDSEEKNQGDG